MTDTCKHCTSRGDLALCLSTPCHKHEDDWIVITLREEIKALKNPWIPCGDWPINHPDIDPEQDVLYAKESDPSWRETLSASIEPDDLEEYGITHWMPIPPLQE